VKNAFLIFGYLVLGLLGNQLVAQDTYQLKIAKLQYDGGGDWYANPTSVPNLISFIRQNTNVQLDENEYLVKPSGNQIFQYPYVYMTGHGNVNFSDEEARNLRKYLVSGGFLHIDDNYGMDKFVRREMKKIFPDLEFQEIDFAHPIFHTQYDFDSGLPKVHEHDNQAPQALALIFESRIVCLYTFESDLGDGWEDAAVHNDPADVRRQALQMGTNIVIYALTH